MIIDERGFVCAELRNLFAHVNNGDRNLSYDHACRAKIAEPAGNWESELIAYVDESDQDGAVLSSREREILALVVDGQSAKAIAQRTGLSPRTVERHIENCRHKLRARNTAQLVSKALESGALG